MKLADTHITLSSSKTFCAFCEPLFQNTEITCFEYNRHYFDGYGFTLNSKSPILTKEYFIQSCYPTLFEIETYYALSKYAYLDESFNKRLIISNEKGKWENNINIQKPFEIHERFYIFEKTNSYFNLYGFSCGAHNTKSLAYYIEHMIIFEKFIKYFNHVAKDLLSDCEKNRFHLDLNHMLTPNIHPLIEDEKMTLSVFDQLIQSAQNNKNAVLQLSLLTKAEDRCLTLAAQGFTSKEIGKKLNISYRTVEQHIANMKSKLNLNNIKQLIQIYYENKINL